MIREHLRKFYPVNIRTALSNCSFAIGVALLIYTAFRASHGDNLIYMFVAGIAAVLASRIDDIARFKLSAGGMEGEMRSVIQEARASVDQLQRIAVAQSKVILQQLQAEGRWGGGLSIDRKEGIRNELVSALKNIGVDGPQLADVLAVERPFVLFDYANWVTRPIERQMRDKETEKAWNEFFSHEIRRGIGTEPSPEDLEAFLTKNNLLTDSEVTSRLQDYKHFRDTGQHRRPEEWRRRHER